MNVVFRTLLEDLAGCSTPSSSSLPFLAPQEPNAEYADFRRCSRFRFGPPTGTHLKQLQAAVREESDFAVSGGGGAARASMRDLCVGLVAALDVSSSTSASSYDASYKPSVQETVGAAGRQRDAAERLLRRCEDYSAAVLRIGASSEKDDSVSKAALPPTAPAPPAAVIAKLYLDAIAVGTCAAFLAQYCAGLCDDAFAATDQKQQRLLPSASKASSAVALP